MVDIDTRNTLLGEAKKGSKEAVAELCKRYRDPVEKYLRGLGYEDAADITQGFFQYVIEHDFFARKGPERSKFRYYLRQSVRNHANQQRRSEGRQKRGGDRVAVPLEANLLIDETTPEDLFRQHWAQVILDRASRQLLSEYTRRKAEQRGRLLVPLARRIAEPGEYEEIGKALDIDAEAVRQAVKRMRDRYEQIVRLEVAQTVSTTQQLDEEIRALDLERLDDA